MSAIAVVNVFTPKAGQLDAFVAVQKAGLPALRGKVPGLRGSRFYRALDERTALLLSVFESAEHFDQFRQSELFAAHRDKLTPLLERTDPHVYQLVYETGTP